MGKSLILTVFGLTTLFFLSCQSSKELEDYRTKLQKVSNGNLGDPSIKLYYTEEEKESKVPGNSVLATCYNYGLHKYIDVHKDLWYNLSEPLKIVMMAHEFIHCEKNSMGHSSGIMPDNCSSSIMNPTLIDLDCYSRHKNLYLDEIKNWK